MEEKNIVSINMGLNTEPDFLKADSIIDRLIASGEIECVGRWKRRKQVSLELRDKIIETVERDGECLLNWSCTGESRFNTHAIQWEYALRQYKFTIDRYYCHVAKA